MENNVDRVKIINTGVKSFARADNKGSECDYRSGLILFNLSAILILINYVIGMKLGQRSNWLIWHSGRSS